MTESNGTDHGGIEPLDASEAPNVEAPNRLLVTFRNDNSFDGMKIEVLGVSSLQIVAAIYHLTRIANALDDAQMQRAAMERAETDMMLAELNRGARPGGSVSPLRRGGRN